MILTKSALDAESSDDEVMKKTSQLNADSSDDENVMMSRSLHLNADSSDDEVIKKKPAQLNADSSDEEVVSKKKSSQLNQVMFGNVNMNADSSDEEQILKGKSSQLNADSSDDEDDKTKESSVKSSNSKTANRNALDSSDDEIETSKKTKKAIIDSDDEDVDHESSNQRDAKIDSESGSESVKSTTSSKTKKTSKIRKTIQSDDSDDESQDKSQSSASGSQSQTNLLKNKDLYDAESSDNELPDIPRYSKESDNDSDDSNANDSNNEEESMNYHEDTSGDKSKKRGGERKSAQAAMMEIRSESARITRESAIGLPYHRPKQRSLEEFLNRKKGTPEILKSMNLKRLDSNVDKLMEEREMKLKEFFKADSDEENVADDEEDPEDKDFDPRKSEGDQEKLKDVERTDSVDTEKIDIEIDNVTSVMKDSGIFSNQASSEESNQNSEEESLLVNSDLNIKSSEELASQMDTPIEEPQQTTLHPEISIGSNKVEDDTFRLELEPDTESIEIDKEEESLKLVLETETELEQSVVEASPKVDSGKPVNKAWARIQALKNKVGDKSDLEKTLNITPKLQGNCDEMVILEPEKPSISSGAQKLFEKFFKHSKASGKKESEEAKQVEDIKIVTKKMIDGKEVLLEEVVKYKKEDKKSKQFAGRTFLNFKAKLKQEMMEKKRNEIMQKREMMKINNEEGFEDELPDDEEVDDEEYENEGYDDEEEMEDEEGESEPEEDDMPIKDKKRKKSAFVDDEAEDEDEEYDDDNDSIAFEELPQKKTQFKKIIQDPELMSESSNQSDIFNKLDRIRGDAETPTLNNSAAKLTSAPSSNSSFGAIAAAEPRWTPFQDRTNIRDLETTSADNSLQKSPTQSQMAKKKLGFEGLFDATDPDVTDIDDVIGLCSGQFVSQQEDDSLPPVTQTQNDFSKILPDLSGLAPVQNDSKIHGIESQDTVILTGSGSRPGSRAENIIGTQDDTVLLQQEKTLNASINNILKNLEDNDDEVGHGVIVSDEEEESSVDTLKVSKKRKGRLLSDSEDSGEENEEDVHQEEENTEEAVNEVPEYDSDENEIIQPQKAKQRLFDKKGKLRKDFYDVEAELSDEEGRVDGLSDDEDEKGLDKFELEEGDLDEIDEDAEREKVPL